MVVEEVLVEVFTACPRDRAQQRFLVLFTSALQFLSVAMEVLVEVFMVSLQGQGSTAVCGADSVVSPVPHGREGSLGGVQGFSPGQGSTAVCGAANVVSPVPHGRGWSRGVVQGFLPSQGPAALSEQGSVPAVHSAPAPVGEFMASAPSVHAAPVSSGDDASRVEQDIDVEGVDYLGRMVYHTGTCVMLDMEDFKWRSLGEGTFRLLRYSTGSKCFQFWRHRQLLVDDDISGLALGGSSKGLSWRWRNPEFEDGPSDYRHAVRFRSPVPARRFYDEWYSS